MKKINLLLIFLATTVTGCSTLPDVKPFLIPEEKTADNTYYYGCTLTPSTMLSVLTTEESAPWIPLQRLIPNWVTDDLPQFSEVPPEGSDYWGAFD